MHRCIKEDAKIIIMRVNTKKKLFDCYNIVIFVSGEQLFTMKWSVFEK